MTAEGLTMYINDVSGCNECVRYSRYLDASIQALTFTHVALKAKHCTNSIS